ISRTAKLKALALVTVVFAASIIWALETTPGRLAMCALGLALVTFLARLPETPTSATVADEEPNTSE
ncbi:MAG: YbaN family protein, partial [Planctomycetota bacterium]